MFNFQKVRTVKTPPIRKYRSPWATCMPPARDLTLWPLHVTSPVTPGHGLCAAQINSWSWVDWTSLHGFAKSTNSSERKRSVVSACDVSRDFFRSRWASASINLVCLLLGWPFYVYLATFLNSHQKTFSYIYIYSS